MSGNSRREIIFDEVGNFMGTGRYSPSHQYMIAFGSRTTDRDDKYGDRACVLFQRGEPIFRAKLVDRIHDARVDDAGNFCLQTFEWPRKVDGETFLFFRLTGEQYGSLFASGYPRSLGLEDSGGRILFLTRQKVFSLNVAPTLTLAAFNIPRHFQPTDGYTDTERKLVFLSQRGSDYYRFSFSGMFLDEQRWFSDFLNSADGLSIYFAIRDQYCAQTNWTTAQYRQAADGICIALDRGIKDSFHLSRSDVYRFLGVLRRLAGDAPAADRAANQADAFLDGFRVVDRVGEQLPQITASCDQSLIRENLAKLERAEAYPRLNAYPNYFGRLFKFRGMLYLALGDQNNAAAAFRRALEINPRVGCKRQLKLLNAVEDKL
jgi:hypothetical protein